MKSFKSFVSEALDKPQKIKWRVTPPKGVKNPHPDGKQPKKVDEAAPKIKHKEDPVKAARRRDKEREAGRPRYTKGGAKDMRHKVNKESVEEGKKGLWDNIHAKRKRGEKPNPPGHPDRPTDKDFKNAQEAKYVDRKKILKSAEKLQDKLSKEEAEVSEVSNRLARKVIDRGLKRGVRGAGKTKVAPDGTRSWEPPSEEDKKMSKKGAKSAKLGYRQIDRNRKRGIKEFMNAKDFRTGKVTKNSEKEKRRDTEATMKKADAQKKFDAQKKSGKLSLRDLRKMRAAGVRSTVN